MSREVELERELLAATNIAIAHGIERDEATSILAAAQKALMAVTPEDVQWLRDEKPFFDARIQDRLDRIIAALGHKP